MEFALLRYVQAVPGEAVDEGALGYHEYDLYIQFAEKHGYDCRLES